MVDVHGRRGQTTIDVKKRTVTTQLAKENKIWPLYEQLSIFSPSLATSCHKTFSIRFSS